VCPDCGKEIGHLEAESVMNIAVLICVTLAVYVYGMYMSAFSRNADSWSVMLGLVVILLLVLAYALVVRCWKGHLKQLKRESLRSLEERINTRISELRRACGRTDEIRDLLAGRPERIGTVVGEALQRAAISAHGLIVQYGVKLWEIRLLRIGNRIEKLREGALAEDLTACLDAIRKVEDDCLELGRAWSDPETANAPASSRQCIVRLQESLKAVEALRDAFLVRQAHRAVRQIAPLDARHGMEALLPLPDSSAFSFAQQFQALSTELQRLEDENTRLKCEQEVLTTIDAHGIGSS
jgi:hypothetical protein